MKESCLVIAGEKSGEEHALSFLQDLKKNRTDLEFFGVGGDDLQAQGMELIYHLRDFSSMGFTEVIKKIPFYLNAEKIILAEVKKRSCRHAILVDFQGFNLKLAPKLKKLGVKVFYYVAPQAWAWKPWRAKVLAENVHTLYSILPFEKNWFMNRGVKHIVSVEHPLIKTYAQQLKQINRSQADEILFLPGSRRMEFSHLMPQYLGVMTHLRRHYPEKKLSLVLAPSLSKELVANYLPLFDRVYSHHELAPALLKAQIAIAASGTVTLATGLFQVPTIVCYKVDLFNQYVFHNFVKYEGYVSLVNLILEKELFPELLQTRMNSFNVIKILDQWLENRAQLEQVEKELDTVAKLLKSEISSVGNDIAQNW